MMFEHLKDHDVILVTGPIRSGTCLAAKCVAHDTGKEFIPEEAHGFKRWTLLQTILKTTHNAVIHGPLQCRHLEKIAAEFPNVVPVFMLRNPLEIVASERRIRKVRIQWVRDRYLDRLLPKGSQPCLGDIVAWLLYQRHLFENYVELRYETLKAHALWVPDQKRKRFGNRQTVVGAGNDGRKRGLV
jgi:DNA polymerase III delta prime subunit